MLLVCGSGVYIPLQHGTYLMFDYMNNEGESGTEATTLNLNLFIVVAAYVWFLRLFNLFSRSSPIAPFQSHVMQQPYIGAKVLDFYLHQQKLRQECPKQVLAQIFYMEAPFTHAW